MNLSTVMPTEILKLICIVHSTYRTQCTIISVCKKWHKIISASDISAQDMRKFHNLVHEYNCTICTFRQNDTKKIELLTILRVALRPEYRILFIARKYADARAIIFDRCAAYYYCYGNDITRKLIKILCALAD